MGVGYRCVDTKLHREVALKFLSDRFTRMCESQYGHGTMTIAVRGGSA